MSEVKQVIVIRKDLNMRKGKIASQAAHASMSVFFQHFRSTDNGWTCLFEPNQIAPVRAWVEGAFTKIVVYVNSEDELLDCWKRACLSGVPCSLITDSGATEFNGVPTKTAVAIGPWYAEGIDPITGKLPLL